MKKASADTLSNPARRTLLRGGLAMAAAPAALTQLAWPNAAQAAGFPDHSLKMINAFSAGSATDTCGRIIAEGLSDRIGQRVVVENRPGANMIIGTNYAAKSPADGYTLIMCTADNMSINPRMYNKLPYSAADFDPLTLVGRIPMVVMGSLDLPYANFADLRNASLKGNKVFSLGTWGNGSVGHMVGEMLRLGAGLKMNYIPYQGSAPSYTALIGRQIDLAIVTPQFAAQMVNGNQARAFAIGSDARLPELPNCPTFHELGFDTIQARQWHGVEVRAGGNQQIIDLLYKNVLATLNDPVMRPKLLSLGYYPIDGRPPAAFKAFLAEEAVSWGRLVEASGAKGEI